MKYYISCRLIALAGLTVATLRATAQHHALQDDTLATAHVVSHRLPAAATSAVPHHDIDSLAIVQRGITSTADALRRLPGVNLRDYGGAGGLKTVSVRGMGAAHTVVTYDGMPVSDAQNGQIDLRRFSIDRLGSLTLSVADAPALLVPVRTLGAATLSLTSRAASVPLRPVPTHVSGQASLTQASFGTVNPALALTAQSGRTVAGLSGDFYYGRNDYPFTLRNGILTTRERRENSRMQAWNAEADVRTATRGGGSVAIKAYYHTTHQRLPGQVILYTSGNTERLAGQVAAGQALWQQTAGRVSLMGGAKYSWQESRYTDIGLKYPGGSLRQNYWQREAYATAGASLPAGPFTLAYAADYFRNSLNSNLASDNLALRHTLLQALSVRYSHRNVEATARLLAHVSRNRAETAGGDEAPAARNVSRITPSVSLMWQVLHRERAGRMLAVGLRASYKETFREPTFTESYYYHLGSTDLKPELTRQAGAGITLRAVPCAWLQGLTLTADAYMGRVSDRIVSIPYNLFVWRTVNLGSVRTGGLDVAFDARLTPARRHALVPAVSYTLQVAHSHTTAMPATVGKQQAYVPVHSGGASLCYENPWVNVVVHATAASHRWTTNEHVEGTRMPGYAEMGVAAYRTFALRRVRFSLRADLINALDKQYEVIRRYPMPGRAYRITATIKWP